MKFFIFFAWFITPVFALAENFNCNHLIGTWVGEKFEYSINTNRKIVSTFFENGEFEFSFTHYKDGVIEDDFIETGEWACDGLHVGIYTKEVDGSPVEYFEMYRNIELTATYKKYQTVLMDCDVIVGDCKGKIYEAVKE